MERMKQLFVDLLDDRDFYHNMLKIALPIMIQNFISSFLNMVATIMVGELGETAIAAVGIANQYFFFYNMFLLGISAGCGVFISQFWGRGDLKSIKKIMGVGLISALLCAAIFIVFGFLFPGMIIATFNHDPKVIALGISYLRMILISYLFTGITFIFNFSLRSIGKAIQPMIISAVALVFDIFFNYVFIFGKFGVPAMGVAGSALGTVIARIVETTGVLLYIYGTKTALAASVRELTDLSLEFVKKSYRVIAPVILNDICWGLASLVYAAVYGRMGTQAMAAIQICNTVNNLFLVAIFGVSSAAAVMVGNSIGAGQEDLAKTYAKRFSLLSVALGAVLGVCLALAAPLVLSVFNVSDTVRSSSRIILDIISGIFFIRVLGVVLIVGILRGGGDARQAFVIEGFTMWFIGVPLTVLGAFVFKLPVHWVYGLAVLEELSKCILALGRLRSGRWLRNVTRNMA